MIKNTIVDKFNPVERIHIIEMLEYAEKENRADASKALATMIAHALDDEQNMKKFKSWLYGYENTTFMRNELLPDAIESINKLEGNHKESTPSLTSLVETISNIKKRAGNVIDFNEHYNQDAENMYIDLIEAFKSLPYEDEYKEAKHLLMSYTGLSCKPETYLIKRAISELLENNNPDEFIYAINMLSVHDDKVLNIRRFREIINEANDIALHQHPNLTM